MAGSAKLPAQRRTKTGTAECRRLRRRGVIPGNVYGHAQDAVPISVAEDAIQTLVRSGTHVVEVELDGHTDTTIFREVKWDTYGVHVQHFDLLRVDPEEVVTIEVPVELRGIAPGVMAGGILEHHLHSLSIDCRAFEIPDTVVVRIGELQIGQAIHVRDIVFGFQAKIHNNADTVVVQVVEAGPAEEEAPTLAAEAGAAEPEVIGRKAEEETEE